MTEQELKYKFFTRFLEACEKALQHKPPDLPRGCDAQFPLLGHIKRMEFEHCEYLID